MPTTSYVIECDGKQYTVEYVQRYCWWNGSVGESVVRTLDGGQWFVKKLGYFTLQAWQPIKPMSGG